VDPITVAGVVAIALVSITSHEAAHGFVADRLGDSTARELGRLTLNPIPHIDPFFTVLLPLFLVLSGSGFIFGGAKPVPVNVSRLRRPRRDWALVGVAGPATNLIIAAMLAAALAVALRLGVPGSHRIVAIASIGIFLNVLLAVFNLIPIPPLDGSRVVQYFLGPRALQAYRKLEQFGLLIIIGLLFFVPQVQTPLAEAIFFVVQAITAAFGVWGVVEPVLREILFP
jgi:Zn-dependent protease